MATARRKRTKAEYTQEVHMKVALLAGLSPEQAAARRHLVNRLDFVDNLGGFLREELGSYERGDRFVAERIGFPASYPEAYVHKSVAQQARVWRRPFSNLSSYDRTVAKGPLPRGAENWFMAPHPRHTGVDHTRSLFKILGAIPAQPGDSKHRLGVANLRPCEDTCAMLAILADQQREMDFIVFPGQLGALHATDSVRRARELYATGVTGEDEFGADALLTSAMLLPHPERLSDDDSLNITTSGDEQLTLDKTRAVGAMGFSKRKSRIEYAIAQTRHSFRDNGVVTAFLVRR